MLKSSEVKVLDLNSEYFGTAASTLMENAGKNVANFIINKVKPNNKNILILCGTGNNGGDGLVAARYLKDKYNVNLFLIETLNDIKSEISKKKF